MTKEYKEIWTQQLEREESELRNQLQVKDLEINHTEKILEIYKQQKSQLELSVSDNLSKIDELAKGVDPFPQI